MIALRGKSARRGFRALGSLHQNPPDPPAYAWRDDTVVTTCEDPPHRLGAISDPCARDIIKTRGETFFAATDYRRWDCDTHR
jgi:hypothetical protein